LLATGVQGLVTALQEIAIRPWPGRSPVAESGIVRASAGTGGAGNRLRFQQTGASLRQQRSSVLNSAVGAWRLFLPVTFQHGDVFHECIEVRANDGRLKWVQLALLLIWRMYFPRCRLTAESLATG